MKVVGIEKDAVAIQTPVGKVWMDVYVKDGDVVVDWNQYIFHLSDGDHVARRDYQDDPLNFIECEAIAIQALEEKGFIKQNEAGVWSTCD